MMSRSERLSKSRRMQLRVRNDAASISIEHTSGETSYCAYPAGWGELEDLEATARALRSFLELRALQGKEPN
jgi:hypothetical protein